MGYLIRKQTFDPLKGKPETRMDAAGIYPKLTIRFPNAAPFEFCIPCPLVNMPTGQLVCIALANWPTGQRIN
jgi:hypothetical protein